MKISKNKLTASQAAELINILQARFEKNKNRHKGIEWNKVQAKLEASPAKLWSLNEMEMTGGEPDVVGIDKKTNEYIFLRLLPRNTQRPPQHLLRPRSAGIKKGA